MKKIKPHPTQKITKGAVILQLSNEGNKRRARKINPQQLRELAYKRFHALNSHPEYILTPAELKLRAYLEKQGVMSKADIQLQKDEAYWNETFEMIARKRPDLLEYLEKMTLSSSLPDPSIKTEEDDPKSFLPIYSRPAPPPSFAESSQYIHGLASSVDGSGLSAFLF